MLHLEFFRHSSINTILQLTNFTNSWIVQCELTNDIYLSFIYLFLLFNLFLNKFIVPCTATVTKGAEKSFRLKRRVKSNRWREGEWGSDGVMLLTSEKHIVTVRRTLKIVLVDGFILLKIKLWFKRVCLIWIRHITTAVRWRAGWSKSICILWQGRKACFC